MHLFRIFLPLPPLLNVVNLAAAEEAWPVVQITIDLFIDASATHMGPLLARSHCRFCTEQRSHFFVVLIPLLMYNMVYLPLALLVSFARRSTRRSYAPLVVVCWWPCPRQVPVG